MPAILAALYSLIALVVQQAGPAAVGILTEWLSKHREALHNVDPQLVLDLEKAIAGGDLHAISILGVQLYNRVGADPASEPGDSARFQDRILPG